MQLLAAAPNHNGAFVNITAEDLPASVLCIQASGASPRLESFLQDNYPL